MAPLPPSPTSPSGLPVPGQGDGGRPRRPALGPLPQRRAARSPLTQQEEPVRGPIDLLVLLQLLLYLLVGLPLRLLLVALILRLAVP